MTEHYEQQLQRLIDGELDQDQRSQFLRSLDANPDRWREVALAFVEDQTWRSFANEQVNQNNVEPIHAPHALKSKLPENGYARSPFWKRFGPPLLMTAATVLFVLTVALRLNLTDGDSTTTALPETDPGANTLASQPEYTLQLGDVDIPLYTELDQFHSQFTDAGFEVEPEVQQRFMNSGIILEPGVRFIKGRSRDGRSILIPVTGLKFKQYLQ